MDTRLAHDASYEKLTISLRYWLLGKGYIKALKAMEYAAQHHTGTRKDGTPEFSHQIWQAHYIRSITALLVDPEACLIVCFLHDVVEDYRCASPTSRPYSGPSSPRPWMPSPRSWRA